MKLFFTFLLFGLIACCSALPFIDIKNVVTVPPNCAVGQVWVNGQCRDVWIINQPVLYIYATPEIKLQVHYSGFSNLRNCMPGTEWVEQLSSCLYVWGQDDMMRNVVTVPPNCPVGQEYVNGQCRDVWIRNSILFDKLKPNPQDLNIDDASELLYMDKGIITIPNQCPTGQKPDALGFCRPSLD